MDAPKKLRFRFGLRALLIGIAICAIALSWFAVQIQWIQQRREFKIMHGQRTLGLPQLPHVPVFFSLLGEEGVSAWDATGWTDAEISETQQLFPESIVVPNSATNREPGGA